MSSLRVGFIGLGNMGILMARNMVKNGEHLVVYDLRKEAIPEMLSLGAAAAGSSREVAAASDVIFSAACRWPMPARTARPWCR
jgi:3-hydroxyisobutyrate dehydrogenase-like beta-hydroxyacid dehydrogenase